MRPEAVAANARGTFVAAHLSGRRWAPNKIGACLYQLEDGQRSAHYHFHHGIEEWLLVVAGSPVVRTLDGERALREGDVLCFPAGPAGRHQVTGPGTVLIVSETRALDIVEYPDRAACSNCGRRGHLPPLGCRR